MQPQRLRDGAAAEHAPPDPATDPRQAGAALTARRSRPSARILLVDTERRVLLFRFDFRSGPLIGKVFWATPGGRLEPGESFADGARRELAEETGLIVDDPGPEILRRAFVMIDLQGDEVDAEERYFLIRTSGLDLQDAGWTDEERETISEHRWWTAADLRAATEVYYPTDLADVLEALLSPERSDGGTGA